MRCVGDAPSAASPLSPPAVGGAALSRLSPAPAAFRGFQTAGVQRERERSEGERREGEKG